MKFVMVGAPGAVTVKFPLLVAIPPGVTIVIGPLVAPLGTVAVICVPELTEKLAFKPLKNTVDAPVKSVPVITTLVPTGPEVGVKLVMVGAGGVVIVKSVLLVATPPGVMTVIGPVVAPAGTLNTLICESVTTEKLNWLTGTPLNRTALAPVKLVPLICTLEPGTPLVGENVVMVGAGIVKFALLVAVPPGVVTAMGPAVARLGTVAVICVPESTVNDATTPLKVTEVAPVKFVPVIVTCVPTTPLSGEKLTMVGAGTASTVKFVALVAVPAGVVTAMAPVVAPAGTAATISVAEFTKNEAGTPLKVTPVAPVKFVPVIVTGVPTGPLPGVKLVIVGAGTMKVAPVAVPLDVVTVTGPLLAPKGTEVVICVAESTLKKALTPLKRTLVAPLKLVPVMTTAVPGRPPPGAMLVIVGRTGAPEIAIRSCCVPFVQVVPPSVLVAEVPNGLADAHTKSPAGVPVPPFTPIQNP